MHHLILLSLLLLINACSKNQQYASYTPQRQPLPFKLQQLMVDAPTMWGSEQTGLFCLNDEWITSKHRRYGYGLISNINYNNLAYTSAGDDAKYSVTPIITKIRLNVCKPYENVIGLETLQDVMIETDFNWQIIGKNSAPITISTYYLFQNEDVADIKIAWQYIFEQHLRALLEQTERYQTFATVDNIGHATNSQCHNIDDTIKYSPEKTTHPYRSRQKQLILVDAKEGRYGALINKGQAITLNYATAKSAISIKDDAILVNINKDHGKGRPVFRLRIDEPLTLGESISVLSPTQMYNGLFEAGKMRLFKQSDHQKIKPSYPIIDKFGNIIGIIGQEREAIFWQCHGNSG